MTTDSYAGSFRPAIFDRIRVRPKLRMRPEMIRCRQQTCQKRQAEKNDNDGFGSVLLYRHGD